MEQTNILVKPIISEKSLNQSGTAGCYTFAVALAASKPEIKRAIEKAFKVKVLDIRTARVKGKTRRSGKRQKITQTSAWKKAFIWLPGDQKIDLFEAKND